MNKLEAQISEFEQRISDMMLVNEGISKAPVGWHIEHILLATNGIIDSLVQSNPANYKWSFNFWRTLVLTTNKIPRGRGKAPSRSRPKDDFTKETLEKHILKTKRKLTELQSLDKNSYFEHPYFGQLNLKPCTKFLKIHAQHHLNIINDIIKSC